MTEVKADLGMQEDVAHLQHLKAIHALLRPIGTYPTARPAVGMHVKDVIGALA